MIFFKSDNCLIFRPSTATQLSTNVLSGLHEFSFQFLMNRCILRYKSVKSVKIKINGWTEQVFHRFLSIYRYNRYQSNQIYPLIDISILIFIDLLLRANWQQKTTLHVQHTFLPLFCTTTTWIFLVSHFMEKKCRMCLPKILMLVLWLSQFQASPSPRAFVILFWKS